MKKAWLFPLLFLVLCLASCSSARDKTYRIARDPTWYPLDMQGKEKYIFAFSDDLIMAIADKERLHIELQVATWESLEDGLRGKRCDAILSSMMPRGQNEALFSFSNPYLMLGPVLVVPFDSRATSLDDMEGKIVAVETGSQAVILASRYPNVIIRTYDAMTVGLEDVARGNVDGALLPVLIARAYARDLYQGVLKVATPPMGHLALRLVTLKDQDKKLIDWFDNGLKALIDDGTYDKLLQKWSLN